MKIVYLHDGNNIYDQMFLEHLAKRNTVHFLTFYHAPRFVPKGANLTKMKEPFRIFANRDLAEGIRMYSLFLLRSMIIRLYIRLIRPQVVVGCMATKYGFYSAVAGLKPTVLIIWGSDLVGVPKRMARSVEGKTLGTGVLALKLIVRRVMARFALKKASAVVLDSRVQEEAALQLGCSPTKILNFPWFDTNRIVPLRSKEEVRRELGWDKNVIVFSARSHESIYGVEHLIDAMPQIIKAEPTSRFLILGGGSLTGALKRRVKRLDVGEYVKFLGRVPREEVFTYLNASDINVSTSFSDGTSASLLESMTLAIPSVVTEISGNREWVNEGKNGYLVPVGESEILAERILHLVRDKTLRREIGNHARRTVEQRVDWRKNMETLDNIIQKLAERKN